MAETGEKPLRIHQNNACGEFSKLGTEIFLKKGTEPTIVAIFNKIKETYAAINHLTISMWVLIW